MSFNLKYYVVIAFIAQALSSFGVLSQDTEILYNLAKIGSVSDTISVDCRNDLARVINSINDRKIWAMKLLDTSGKFGSGFVWGNNYLLGDHSGCLIINDPVYITQTQSLNPLNSPHLITDGSPFPVEYRMVYIRHSSRLQFDLKIYDRKILHIGLCFPESCQNVDTLELAENYFYKDEYVGHELIGNNITVLRTKALKLRSDFWSHTFVKMLTWITVFNLLNIVIGTIYTYNGQKKRSESLKKTDDMKSQKASLMDRWFRCFSLIENTNSIFSLNLGDDSIKVVHGIRVLGMVWLVLAHVSYFGSKSAVHLEFDVYRTEIWYYQPITTNFLGIETFIVFGAFLLSFLYFERLKRPEEMNGVVQSIKAIIFRYIRFTPLYFIVILMTYAVTVYLEDTTPFTMLEDYEKNCKVNFWLNLFYINNLYPMKDSCLIWSWYLANDFQSVVIALIVLAVFRRNKKLGLLLGTGISLVAMGVSMYFAVKVKFSFALDNYFNTADVLYFPTWNRIATYFVGIVAGWYFSKENRQLRLSKFYIVLYWIIAEIIIFGSVFLHVYKEYNPILAVVYSGFERILWGIANCWILIACASNNGGLLTKIFESKIWIPFSRMTFACYLINPVVIVSAFHLMETAFNCYLSIYITFSLGIIVLSFLASYFLMVIYEKPFNTLIKTFIVAT